jgi:hypothetical protein
MIWRTVAFRTGAGTCFATVENVNAMSFSFYDDAYGADYAVLSANVSSYTPNSGVLLTLQGGPEAVLKGILIYATTGNATDSRVGTFTNLTSKYQFANCGSDGSTVTHSNRDHAAFPTFQWIAPAPTTGTVQFHTVLSIGPYGDTSLWTILQPLVLTEADGSQIGSSSGVFGSSSITIDVSSSSSSTVDAVSSSIPVVPQDSSTGHPSLSSSGHPSLSPSSVPAGVSSSTGTTPPPPPPTPSVACHHHLHLSSLLPMILVAVVSAMRS